MTVNELIQELLKMPLNAHIQLEVVGFGCHYANDGFDVGLDPETKTVIISGQY